MNKQLVFDKGAEHMSRAGKAFSANGSEKTGWSYITYNKMN